VRGGSRTAQLLGGSYSDDLTRRWLDQYRRCALVVTVARHLEDGLRALGLMRVRTIPNGVDLRQFPPKPRAASLLRRLAIGSDAVVVMHLANLQPRKRPLDLIEAAHLALARDPRLMFVIVGHGPLRSDMEEACARRGLSEHFRFVGWVEHRHVPDYVNLADMVVVPSEAEGLARVYLEAQACARVLIASDIPPAREVIVDGQTGLLFRVGAVGNLAAKMLVVARSRRLRCAIGSRARKQAARWSLGDAVGAYVEALEEVVREGRCRDG
jgi:glycosyltransferase involved in cell wall biosynthesis